MCEALGLTPVPATQVIARDRHAELLYTCASVGATIESFAMEIRHLQRTEVREVEEPFRSGSQKGSSAMPHKRNPVKCEQLCGLARVLRGNLQAGMENVALWHERDISHSSVERIMLPDSLELAYYVLVKFRSVVEGMHVYPERMRENLDASYGLVFSQPVLLALVESGMSRDDAYRAVQRNAMLTWESRRPFIEVLRRGCRRRRRALRRTSGAVLRPHRRAREHRPYLRRARRRCRRWPPREQAVAATPLQRQGARALRGRSRSHARRGVGPHLGVRRRARRPDPRQGPRAHRAVHVLVRADRTPRAQPPRVVRPHRLPRDRRPRRRGSGDAGARGAAGAARVRRAWLPVRVGVVRLRGDRLRRRARAARRAASGRATARADLHAHHQGRVPATTCPLDDAEAAAIVGDDLFEQVRDLTLAHLRVRRRARRRAGADPRRHQARVRASATASCS